MTENTITRRQEFLLWLVPAALSGACFIWLVGSGYWPFESPGKLKLSDFAPIWAAGHRAIDGQAVLAYDVAAHDAFVGALRDSDPPNRLVFGYPPATLLLAAPLALLDYAVALIFYLAAGFVLFAALLRKVTGNWLVGSLMAISVGGPTATIWLGQNGFLTASAMTGGLLLMRHNPRASGICFGLLTIKPHLALVVFAALFLWGEWRALFAAIATSLVLLILPTLIFGIEIWSAYIQASREIVAIVADQGDWLVGQMMQSIFTGLSGHIGVANAMGVQLAVAATAIFAVATIPADRADERAAAVIAATLLAIPYAFLYDATMLVAATAFLLRSTRALWLHLAGAAALLWVGSWFVQFTNVVPLAAFLIFVLAIYRGRPLRLKFWQPSAVRTGDALVAQEA